MLKRVLFLISWPFRRLPIPLSLFLVINMTTGVGFYFAYRNMNRTYDAFKTREEEVQLNTVQHLSHQIDREMGHSFLLFENFSASISNSLQLLGFDSAYRYFKNRGALRNFMERNPAIVALVIRDILGRQYLESGNSGVDLSQWSQELGNASAEALRGNPYQSPILKSESRFSPVVLFSEPVRDAGNTVVAGLVVALSLKPLIQNLITELPDGYQLFICDKHGALITHSRSVYSDHALPQYTPGCSYAEHPLVQASIRSRNRINQVLSYRSFEQKTFLGCSAPSAYLPWIIGLEIDQDIAFGTVIRMKKNLKRWFMLTLLFSTCLAFILAHAFRVPLQRLMRGSERVANKSFSRPIELYSNNEFGHLARQFNKMQRAIQLYLDQIQEAALKQKETLLKAIHALVNAIDAKDPYTKGHSRRVSKLSRIIALEMGQTGQLLERTELSALLHDIGKIGIDDNILKKPSQLTEEEYEIMKTHPEKGYKILGAIEDLQPITDGMRYHHEDWKGSGYPLGLKGTAIPLQARIVAVADSFDAMTTNRPYQMAMSWEDGINRLNELSSKRFDPRVVSAITHAFYSGRLVEEDF